MDTICTMGNENGAWRGCTEAAKIERTWATTILMRYTSNWTLFLPPIVQYYLCDARIILEENAI